MKTEAEVQERIRNLLARECDRRIAAAGEKLPQHCVYNHKHALDQRKQIDGEPNDNYNRVARNGLPVVQTIGLCMYGAENPEEWPGTICEDPIDAQRCPLFTAKKTEAEIRQEFDAQLKELDWVRENLPEVHALLWWLGSDKLPDNSVPPPPADDEPSEPPEAVLPMTMSWFTRLILRLLGLQPARVERLLPAPSKTDD